MIPAVLPRQRRKREMLADARAAAERAEVLAEARRQVAAEREARRVEGAWGPRALSLLVSLTYRSRKVGRPLLALGALHLAGVVVSRETVPPGLSLVLALALAAVAWGVRYRRLSRESERRYAAALTVAVVLWLAWTALAGSIELTDWWLWFVGALASVPWFAHHWPRSRRSLPEVPPVDESVPARFSRNCAGKGRFAEGAQMTGEVATTEHYSGYSIELDPGVQSAERLGRNIDLLESGLRIPREQLHVETPHPLHPSDPAMVQLRVMAKPTTTETSWLRRTTFRDGMIGLGPHIDNDGTARWRVFTQNRMHNGVLFGGTGIGKSRLLEVMALTMRQQFVDAALPTSVVYLDGQNGASSPLLYKHSTWAGGLEESEGFLASLEKAAGVRQAFNRKHGLTGFTPGLVLPGEEEALTALLVIVDECHKIWHSKALAKRWGSLARECGKLGIAIIGSTQATDLDGFGNYEPLRSSLLAGNGLAMRIASKNDGHLIPGLPLDPAKLPAIPGYGVTIAAPKSGLRTAPFRAPFSPSRGDVELGVVVPAGVPLLDDEFAATREAPVDRYTAYGLGQMFADRDKVAEMQRAANEEFLEQVRRGEVEETPRETITVTAAPAPAGGGAGATPTVADVILAMCEESPGPVRKNAMVEKTGATPQAVGQALDKWKRAGVLVRLPGATTGYTTAAKAPPFSENPA